MCYHLPDQVDLIGNINYFSAQGLEKLNDLTTTEYFLATNKSYKNHSFIMQMLQRDLRLSYNTNKSYWDALWWTTTQSWFNNKVLNYYMILLNILIKNKKIF